MYTTVEGMYCKWIAGHNSRGCCKEIDISDLISNFFLLKTSLTPQLEGFQRKGKNCGEMVIEGFEAKRKSSGGLCPFPNFLHLRYS